MRKSASGRTDKAGNNLHGFQLADQKSVNVFNAGHMQALRQYAAGKGNRQCCRAAGQCPQLLHQAVDTLMDKTGSTINSPAQLRGILP